MEKWSQNLGFRQAKGDVIPKDRSPYSPASSRKEVKNI